jgi:nucleoside-triphosphatase THEP1
LQDENKVGIEAVDLCSGEVRLLARTHALDGHEDRGVVDPGHGAGETRVGLYVMDDSVIEWMASLCEEALTTSHEGAAKSLVFVDEIGRLELNRGGGLARLVPLLAERRARCAIAIVRDSLLDRLVARVQAADPHVVKLDAGCRERAWQEIAQLVLESSL